MAEPVIVPVQLEVTDIDMSNFNSKDVQKAISSSLSGVKKSIQDAFSGINPSAINKSIDSAMTSVKKSMQAAEDAQLRYHEAMVRAGKSSEEYKSAIDKANSAISNQQTLVNELSQLGPAAAPALATAQKDLNALIEARNKINPLDFVDKAEPIQLEKVANAFQKVLSATEEVNKKSEQFNQTIKDNRASDEYNELLTKAEAYKKKLSDLNEKSKEMKFKGATDTQWENLRKDVEWTESKMSEVLKQMDKAIKSGKAFRFGEGPKGEFRNQYNSFKMSAQNNASFASKRAKDNQSPYTEDYQKALDDLDKLEKKVQSIKEKSAKMIELGASKKEFANTAYDANKLKSEVEAAKNRITEMVNEGKAFRFGKGDAAGEINKVAQKSQGLEKELEDVANDSNNARKKLLKFKEAHPTLAKILKVAAGIGHGFAKVGQGVGKAAVALGKGVKNMGLFGKAGSRTSGDLNKKFKKLSRNILMFGLGFRTAYYAVKRLRNIFIEGFKAMGEQFGEIGTPMTAMMESFDRLKGSLATVLQPIASIMMPILTTLMNSLTGVMEKIAEFTAVLSGQKYIYKAVAKDINSVADASKNANKQLGSYDKLEVIQNDGTGQEYTQLAVGDAETASSNFAKMVKEAWEKADFTSVGAFISKKLVEVLNNVATNAIPKAMEFVNRILTSINTFLLGFDASSVGVAMGGILNAVVTGLDWSTLGEVFANWQNTVWGFLDGLVNGIDWLVLGQSVNTGLVSLVDNLDFDKIANTISGFITGLITIITSIDWEYIANKLFDGVMQILSTVGTNLANSDNPIASAFGDVILALGEALNNLKPAIDTIVESFGPIVQAILPVLSALLPPISSIISTLVTTLLPPIVRLIEALMPLLINIVELIMPGIERTFTQVSSIIAVVIDVITILVGVIDLFIGTASVISKVFRGEFDSFKDIWDALLDVWKPALNSIISGVEGMVNGIINGINKMIEGLNKLSFSIPDWVPALGGKSFGLSLRTINTLSIPRLAQGAVIPPNQEFLAVLGDQKHGTNIEAPLDTIKQALAEVLAETGGGSRDPIVLRLNGRDIAKVVWDEEEKRYKQTGRYATT